MRFLCQNQDLFSVNEMIPVLENESYPKANFVRKDQDSNPERVDLYFPQRYGIPREVMEALVFEHGGNPTFLEIQSQGILMGLLDQKKLLYANGIISGPTGSGKTLLAELRMLVRYFAGRRGGERSEEPRKEKSKTIFLVPLKSIGREKLQYFRNIYNRFGIQVLYSDGEVHNDDGKILRGKFDVTIMVQEKLKFFEQHNPEFFKDVGEVVVDELGILSTKSRGPTLEMALTGLLLSPYKPSILALTTPLERTEELIRFLGGFLLETEDRPLDIRAGVWSRQKAEFHSWSCNTAAPYPTEKWDLDYPVDKDKMLKELVLRYKQGIMFALPSRSLTLSYASRLCQLIDKDPEVKKVMVDQIHSSLSIEDRLKGLEATKNKEQLTDYLKRGIGFHHADLSMEERKEVEDAFRNREIAVMFCTSTLARGINLPAETIIFLDWKTDINFGEQTCSYYGQLLDEFTNWMGRIGRPGGNMRVQPVAIYLAQTAVEAQQIEHLILSKRARLSPHLADNKIDLTGHLFKPHETQR
jgi:helicase